VESSENLVPQQTLKDYLTILHRRKWAILLTFGLVVGAALLYTTLTKPVYRSEALLLVEASDKAAVPRTGNPITDLQALAQPQALSLHLMELQSSPFLDRAFRKLKPPAGARFRQPKAEASEDYPGLISVTVESTDAMLAAAAANLTVDEYLVYARQTALKEVENAKQFVLGEGERARRELAEADRRLVLFRRQLGVPQLGAEQETRTRQILDLEQRLEDNANALSRVAAQVSASQAELGREPKYHRIVSERGNARRDALEAKLAELETQRAALLAEYREDSPMLTGVDAQIDRVKQRLGVEPAKQETEEREPNPVYDQLRMGLHELKREQRGLAIERGHLTSQLAAAREKADRLLPREVQLTALTTKRDSAKKLLQTMEDKLQDLVLREKQWRPSARVFEYAQVPAAPIKPRTRAILVMAVMIGIALGLALAFLLEALDDRITTPEQVERELGLPVMGFLPLIPSRHSLLMTALPPRSPIAEGYRALRSSISFASVDHPLRTIMVSSSDQSEGKSLTSLNLAIAMALEGRRVILVDADLRRPSLHRLLDMGMSPGLTDVLRGHCELAQALRPFPGLPTLNVITCGERPPNPAEMLNSQQMAELIAFLAEEVDTVIFDCPPVLPVTDATLLSTKVDGVLLVAALGKARRPGLVYTKEQFVRARARLVGLVFNKVNGSLSGFYPYYDRGYYEEDRRGGATRPFHALARLKGIKEKPTSRRNGKHPEDPASTLTGRGRRSV
jgi:capsular exopolysaccharide synthesis family protein